TGQGFDWRPTQGREREVGHAVELAVSTDVSRKRALRITYNGKRQADIPIAQYLAATPGRYELSGLAQPQSLGAGRGVRWALRCVKGGEPGAPLGISERFLGSSEWRRFAFEVMVPADCPGQVLQVEPAGAEDGPVYLSGTVWFDDIVLRRL